MTIAVIGGILTLVFQLVLEVLQRTKPDPEQEKREHETRMRLVREDIEALRRQLAASELPGGVQPAQPVSPKREA